MSRKIKVEVFGAKRRSGNSGFVDARGPVRNMEDEFNAFVQLFAHSDLKDQVEITFLEPTRGSSVMCNGYTLPAVAVNGRIIITGGMDYQWVHSYIRKLVPCNCERKSVPPNCGKNIIVHHLLEVEAQVTVTPHIKHGKPTISWVKSNIRRGCNYEEGNVKKAEISDGKCTFNVAQIMCVEIPITLDVEVEVDQGRVKCCRPGIGPCTGCHDSRKPHQLQVSSK